jgi:hypothetical protein
MCKTNLSGKKKKKHTSLKIIAFFIIIFALPVLWFKFIYQEDEANPSLHNEGRLNNSGEVLQVQKAEDYEQLVQAQSAFNTCSSLAIINDINSLYFCHLSSEKSLKQIYLILNNYTWLDKDHKIHDLNTLINEIEKTGYVVPQNIKSYIKNDLCSRLDLIIRYPDQNCCFIKNDVCEWSLDCKKDCGLEDLKKNYPYDRILKIMNYTKEIINHTKNVIKKYKNNSIPAELNIVPLVGFHSSKSNLIINLNKKRLDQICYADKLITNNFTINGNNIFKNIDVKKIQILTIGDKIDGLMNINEKGFYMLVGGDFSSFRNSSFYSYNTVKKFSNYLIGITSSENYTYLDNLFDGKEERISQQSKIYQETKKARKYLISFVWKPNRNNTSSFLSENDEITPDFINFYISEKNDDFLCQAVIEYDNKEEAEKAVPLINSQIYNYYKKNSSRIHNYIRNNEHKNFIDIEFNSTKIFKAEDRKLVWSFDLPKN